MLTPSPSRPRGSRLRLFLLAATAASFLLVPTTQALAEHGEPHLKVNLIGFEAGGGEVFSPGFSSEPFPGTPEIECTLAEGASEQEGVCENMMSVVEPEALWAVGLRATANPYPNSEFLEWEVVPGKGFLFPGFGCSEDPTEPECIIVSEGEDAEINAYFACEEGKECPPPGVPLTINPVGSGTGQVNCKVNGGETDEPCAAQYEAGTELELIADPDEGSEFAGFENGTGDAEGCTTSPCGPFTLEVESELGAKFELEPVPTFPLEVTVTGEGEVTSTPAGIECTEAGNGTAACEEEFAEGSSVTLQAEETVSEWVFVEWTAGPCEGESTLSCEFTMPAEAEQATALFVETNEAPLSLIKGGYFEGGTVTSNPAGINCGTACEAQMAEFEEGQTVTLTATAAEGYAFAGWLNCKFVSVGVCEVTVEGPLTEVTAIFLKDGEDGEDGEGVTVTPEPPGVNCPNGGVKVESSAGTEYVCNGEDGEDGSQGAAGEDGKDGAQGPAGQNGADGQNGAAGPQGPQGAQGPQGPAGKVTCKVKKKRNKVKVICKVKTAAASSSQVRWRLMRGGKVRSHGTTSARRLQRTLNSLPEGRYVLRIKGQRRGTRIVVH